MIEVIDYDAGRFWFSVFTWITAVSAGFYAWWANRTRVTSSALDRLDRRIEDVRVRVAAAEKDIKAMPSHQDMANLHHDLSGLRADVREMHGSMRGLNRAVDLMTEHLINKAK